MEVAVLHQPARKSNELLERTAAAHLNQFIGIAIPMIFLFLNLNYQTGSFAKKLARVDWIGMVLFISSTTGILIPISWGGVMYPWSHWRTLVPLILCAFGLLAFIIYEEMLQRRGGEPMIRFGPLKTRTGSVTYFATFIRESFRQSHQKQ